MNLTKPNKYLIPAIHQWLSENVERIHINIIRNFAGVILKDVSGKIVPVSVQIDSGAVIKAEFEMITLSIGYSATNKLEFEKDGICFQARFNGKVQDIYIPYLAIKSMSSPDIESSPGFVCAFEQTDLAYAIGDYSQYLADQQVDTVITKSPTVISDVDNRVKRPNHLKVVK